MKCEKIINTYLNQDDSRYSAFQVRLHILFCRKCRTEIKAMQNIFVKARTNSPFIMPEDMADPVMRILFNSETFYEKNISSAKWFFPGAVIFSSIFLVSYSDSFIWLKLQFGGVLEVPVYIVLGLIITFYSALYMGTHTDELKKFLEFLESRMH